MNPNKTLLAALEVHLQETGHQEFDRDVGEAAICLANATVAIALDKKIPPDVFVYMLASLLSTSIQAVEEEHDDYARSAN